jgi:hypothetical protein
MGFKGIECRYDEVQGVLQLAETEAPEEGQPPIAEGEAELIEDLRILQAHSWPVSPEMREVEIRIGQLSFSLA